ncbi:hypothetical protein [Streptomyces sp. CC224B]|uniref:hypothetical protein n=1 Tax=Streptomyces sp. CC224B TaxID=3044571 RepID=UPI0024A99F83|nr:hypothetical protein [Streptomyces sp. CC224B]
MDQELAAMKSAYDTLAVLSTDARHRALEWLAAVFVADELGGFDVEVALREAQSAGLVEDVT